MENKDINFETIVKDRRFQYILLIVIILLLLGLFIKYKFLGNSYLVKETVVTENNKMGINGTIKTDVENGIKDDNISRYTIGDGYSEVEDVVKPNNNSTTNNYPIVSVDNSSLSGRDITISEGDSFEAIRDLKLYATDKDGSNISSKINIESNTVNTEKAGVYSVIASVTLSNGIKLQKVLTVSVKAVDLNVSVESFKAEKEKFERNEKVTLNLNIKSSKKYVKANTVMINGKEYSLYKGSTSLFSNIQKYKVIVDADEVTGKRDYKLSYIKMSDNTLINVDKTATAEILKAEGQIKNFTYKEDGVSKRILAKFNLEDIDNSVYNLRMEVYKNKELIHTENLEKKDKYEVYINTYTNGTYNIKLIADININSEVTEENTIKNKEIFSETIKVSNINESSLTGKSIEILKGQKFEPIADLELKATDVHGEDITNKIVIDSNDVDVNNPGKYEVKAHVVNKKNAKLEGSFTVTVKEEVENSDIEEELEVAAYSEAYSNDDSDNDSNNVKNGRASARDIVSGNNTDTLDANVKVTGTVKKSDGSYPGGKIQVEVPTRLAFTVDQSGNFKSPVFTIKNNSDTAVSVSVGSFNETKYNDGITVHPLSKDLTNLDRSNVHLYLNGDKQVDLGEKITTDQDLVEIPAADSKTFLLYGDAGKAQGTKVDKDGATEDFNLVFKIKKKK